MNLDLSVLGCVKVNVFGILCKFAVTKDELRTPVVATVVDWDSMGPIIIQTHGRAFQTLGQAFQTLGQALSFLLNPRKLNRVF